MRQPQTRYTNGGTRQRADGCCDADERAHTEEIIERQVLAGSAPQEIGGDRRFGCVAAGKASRGEDRNARRPFARNAPNRMAGQYLGPSKASAATARPVGGHTGEMEGPMVA